MSDPSDAGPLTADGAGADGAQHHAFVSYARRPTDQRFVDDLCRELEARGKRVWVDRSDIPPGADWLARITKGIEGASSLIFVLSPHSAGSSVCQQELSIALEQNKRVIPVLHEAVEPSQLPPALARLNWISFTQDDDRDEALARLLEAIETDLEWRDAHTRLTVRVNEWLESGRDGSFLLRGRDLRAAEEWYAARAGHKELPTAGQGDYIMASRRAASRRQRLTLGAVSIALAVAVVLAIFALVQRSSAQHQAKLALSGELAAEASASATTDVRLESLLGLEAFSRSPTTQGRSAVVGAAEQPLIETMPGIAGDPTYAVAYSHSGQIVAAGTRKGVELWNVQTRARIGSPLDATSQINGVAFSPHGQLLAVAAGTPSSSSGAATVYRIGSPKPLYQFSLPNSGGATAVAFSPSSDQVAVTTNDGSVLLWNPAAHSYVAAVVAKSNSSALSVAFNRAGTELAVAVATPTDTGESGSVVVYRVESALAVMRRYTLEHYDFEHVAFAPNGVTLAAASDSGSVELFDTSQDRTSPTATISVGKPVEVVAFNPAGTLLATGDQSGAVRLWNPSTDAQVGETMEDGSVAYGLAFAPDGLSLCSAGYDGSLFVWDSSGVTPLARAISVDDQIHQLALSSAGHELVTIGYQSGIATAWDITDGRRIGRRVPASPTSVATTPDSDVPATAAAVNRRGSEVALGLVNGDVLLENATLNATLGSLPESGSPTNAPDDELLDVAALAFSHDGRFVAVGLEDGQVTLWTVHPASRVASFQFGSPQALNPGVTALAFNPAGTALVVSTESAGTFVINPDDPKASQRYLNTDETLFSLAFTPDGAKLVAGDDAGNLELFDTASPARTGSIYPPPRTAQGDGNVIYAVAVSPDGQTIATGDSTGTVRLWDLATGQQLGVAVPSGAALFDAAFSSATDQLVTGNGNGEVLVWPALLLSHSPAAFSHDLCPRLSTNLTSAQWAQYVNGQPYHATCPDLGAG